MRRFALAILIALLWFSPANAAIIFPPDTGGSINGNITVRSGDSIGFSSSATDSTVACDTCLVRISSDILAQQRGTAAAQTFRVYGTDAGTYLSLIGTNGVDVELLAGGSTTRALTFGVADTRTMQIDTNGQLVPIGTRDLGTSASLWANGYFSVSLVIGAAPATALTGGLFSNGVAFASLGTPSNGMIVFCTDCDPPTLVDSTCTSTGAKTGTLAVRQNGAWKCIS
mgnify:CR=1 FL=1